MCPAGNNARYESPGFYGVIGLSLLVHGLVLSFLVFTPALLPSPPLTFGPAYSVQLVSMPAGLSDDGAEKTAMKDILEGLPVQQPLLGKAAADSLPAIPLHSRPTVKKTDESIENVLEAMRKNLTSAVKSHAVAPATAAPGSRAEQISAVPGEGEARAGMRDYYALIWSRIKGLWTIPRGLMPQENIEAVVTVQILRDGTIAHVGLEKGSGNRYFDESALRTVKKANPLPPLPETFRGGGMEVGIRFRSAEFR